MAGRSQLIFLLFLRLLDVVFTGRLFLLALAVFLLVFGVVGFLQQTASTPAA